MNKRLLVIISVFTILLSVGFALCQMTYLAKNQSITTDEKVHIPAGFTYWQFRNFYLNPEHPPLAKLLVALPVFLHHPKYPDTTELFKVEKDFYYDSWAETRAWGQDFLFNSGNDLHQIVFSARMVNIILTLCLILFLSFWSFQIGSWLSASLTAILASFCPLILAHGSLANTDLLITLDFSLLCYFWWRYLKERKLQWFLMSALIFGVSALSKFSFVGFIPVLVLTSLVVALADFRKKSSLPLQRRLLKKSWSAFLKALIFVIIVWFLIMLFYGFSFKLAPAFTGLPQLHEALSPVAIRAIQFFRSFLVPAWYFKGLFMILGGAVYGRGAIYIFGHFITGGSWFYFPLTIIFKTPIGFLGLLAAAICLIKRFWKRDYILQLVLLGGSVIYLAVAMASKTNLGQRHIMPIYPLLIVFVSQIVLTIKQKWQMVFLGLVIIAVILSTIFNYSNQIAYYNELIGGTKNGYKVLLDSNYDWGQSLPQISDYISKHKNEGSIYLQYQWRTPNEEKYYNFSVPDLKAFDATKDALIIIDPSSLEKAPYAWTKSLPVVDRIANTIFVLQYRRNTSLK